MKALVEGTKCRAVPNRTPGTFDNQPTDHRRARLGDVPHASSRTRLIQPRQHLVFFAYTPSNPLDTAPSVRLVRICYASVETSPQLAAPDGDDDELSEANHQWIVEIGNKSNCIRRLHGILMRASVECRFDCIPVLYDLTNEEAVREAASVLGVEASVDSISQASPNTISVSHFGSKFAVLAADVREFTERHPELVLRNQPDDGFFKVYVIAEDNLAVHLPVGDQEGSLGA